jgi:hypothetical protein
MQALHKNRTAQKTGSIVGNSKRICITTSKYVSLFFALENKKLGVLCVQ